jgi:hypothetical protein
MSGCSSRTRTLVLSPPDEDDGNLPVAHLHDSGPVPSLPPRTSPSEIVRVPQGGRRAASDYCRLLALPGSSIAIATLFRESS